MFKKYEQFLFNCTTYSLLHLTIRAMRITVLLLQNKCYRLHRTAVTRTLERKLDIKYTKIGTESSLKTYLFYKFVIFNFDTPYNFENQFIEHPNNTRSQTFGVSSRLETQDLRLLILLRWRQVEASSTTVLTIFCLYASTATCWQA